MPRFYFKFSFPPHPLTSFLLFVIILSGCSSSKKERVYANQAEKRIYESCDYYFGEKTWGNLKGEFTFQTGKDSKEFVVIDNSKNTYSYTKKLPNGNLIQKVLDGKGVVTYQNKLIFDWEKYAERLGLWKIDPVWWSKYHDFILGLPYKLTEDQVLIDSTIRSVAYKEEKLECITVTFKGKPDQPLWEIFYQPGSPKIHSFSFYFNDELSEGERVICKDEIDFQGYKFPKKRTWFYIKKGVETEVGTDEIIEVKGLE